MHLAQGIEIMQVSRHERQSGQQSFFGGPESAPVDPRVSEDEFEKSDILVFEKELLGLYVSADPLDEHREVISLYCRALSTIDKMSEGETAIIGGWITNMRRISTKNGDPMAFVSIGDGEGDAEVTVFPRVLQEASDSVDIDRFILLRVSAGRRNGEIGLVAEEVLTVESLSKQGELSVNVTLTEDEISQDRLARLQTLLCQHPGDAPFVLQVKAENGKFIVRAGSSYCVSPTVELQRDLEEIIGQGRVRVSTGADGKR